MKSDYVNGSNDFKHLKINSTVFGSDTVINEKKCSPSSMCFFPLFGCSEVQIMANPGVQKGPFSCVEYTNSVII